MRSPSAAVGAPLRWRRLSAASAIIAVCAVVLPAGGGSTAVGGDLTVPLDAARTIDGPAFAAGFPRSTTVTNVGDVDRDGRPDLLVVNTQGHGGDAVRSNILFGGSWPKLTRLPASGRSGFSIPGRAAAAGDVNGDGHADLVSCTLPAQAAVSIRFGRAGRRTAAPRRFRITNIGDCPRSAGDVDGDGRDDLIVDGPDGAAAVVFGSSRPATVDAGKPGKNGFRIEAKKQPLHLVRPGRRHQRRPSRRPGDRPGPEGQAYPRPLRRASYRRDRSWQTGAPRDHRLGSVAGNDHIRRRRERGRNRRSPGR